MQLGDHSAIGYIWLTTHGRYADGEFESGTYSGGEPTGDAKTHVLLACVTRLKHNTESGALRLGARMPSWAVRRSEAHGSGEGDGGVRLSAVRRLELAQMRYLCKKD